MQLKKQPRKRINRFARILSDIYDVEYKLSLNIYRKIVKESESVTFKTQINAVKFQLQQHNLILISNN
jgi:hypothetical protein